MILSPSRTTVSLVCLVTVALGVIAPCQAKTAKHIGIAGGVRLAEFDWSIAGRSDGTNPNVLSELTWTNLVIFDFHGAGDLGFLDDRLVLAGSLGFGVFSNGDVQDSDYKSDDRTDEYSRSHASNLDDFVADAALSLGYQWTGGKTRSMDQDFPSVRRRLLLQAGVSWNEQRLRMTDGVQVLSRPDLEPDVPPEGPFGGLDSTFQARWVGLWVGVEFEHRVGRRSQILAELEMHWPDYDATANWNLRSDFAHPVSFEQSADGQGYVLVLGWKATESKISGLQVCFRAESWRTDPGIDRTFLADGDQWETRLNEVDWRSALLSVGWRWGP